MSSPAHRFFVKKHLVVFGAGYVGGELARQGLARGMRVTALTRNAEKAAQLREDGVEVIVEDLASHAWHTEISGKFDFVLNSVSSGGSGVKGYQHSYVEGMHSIVEWAKSCEIGTFVYTGSTSVYPQDHGVEVSESAETGTENERVARLLDAEKIARESSEFGRCFILRLAGIYGPSRHHVLNQIRTGGALAGRGDHRLNLIHRDDICRAIWAVFSAPDDIRNEVYNVSDDSPVSKRELVEWLATRLQLPCPVFDPELPSVRRRIVPDRLILNRKIKESVGWLPEYPDYRSGYKAILAAL